MIVYFDLAFWSLLEVIKTKDGDKDFTSYTVIAATLIMALCVIVPILVMVLLCYKFKDLGDKTSK